MTETITWLHISDTHFCKEKHDWNSERIFDRFFDDLMKMQNEYNLCPDLIFFTGDVALGQDNSKSLSLKDQYIEAQEFIEKASNLFSTKIPKENIFIVPGNHDVNRSQITPDQTDWIKNIQKSGKEKATETINELVKSKNKQWIRYMERLEDYRHFLEQGGYNHLLDDPKSLIYSKVYDINGYKIGITGLNSAWSSSSDGEKGNLWLGIYQILSSYKYIKEAIFSISLIHHPPSWFTEFEEANIRDEMVEIFKFCLHGHEHHEWVTLIDQHIRIASGALYSGYGKENVYNFVRLYPRENRGEVFLRKYDNGHWIPRIIGGKTNNDGIYSIPNLNLNISCEELSKDEAKNEEIIQCHESYDSTSISSLPNSYKTREGKLREFEFDVFICYSSKDKPIIQALIEYLKKENITYWIDDEQIDFGDQITQKIEEGLQKSRYVVPCLSKNFSISSWIRAEYGAILNAEFDGNSKRTVIPLILDNCEDDDIPILLRNKKRVTYLNKTELDNFIDFLKKQNLKINFKKKEHVDSDNSNIVANSYVKKLPLETVDLQLLRNNAKIYKISAERCLEQRLLPDGKIESPLVPAIVNLASSIEFYLKFLLAKEGKVLSQHRLLDLFKSLDLATQIEIINITEYNRNNFELILGKHSEVSVEWRNIHTYGRNERMSVNIEFMRKLIGSLEFIVNRS